MKLHLLKPTACLAMTLSLAGCVVTPVDTTSPNALTHGQVQMTLRKGVTTQADVLETFGSPNITTIDAEGREVWTYQRQAQVSQATSSESFGTILLFGASQRAAGFEQSTHTMTLIIKFDANHRVYDFRSRTSNF